MLSLSADDKGKNNTPVIILCTVIPLSFTILIVSVIILLVIVCLVRRKNASRNPSRSTKQTKMPDTIKRTLYPVPKGYFVAIEVEQDDTTIKQLLRNKIKLNKFNIFVEIKNSNEEIKSIRDIILMKSGSDLKVIMQISD